jgi:hypothetical protein
MLLRFSFTRRCSEATIERCHACDGLIGHCDPDRSRSDGYHRPRPNVLEGGLNNSKMKPVAFSKL